ncbi:hypothetical protein [Bacteroides sp. 519]|uniref:hypothetical protein n=1 Tax=Bacteroides sp. 519 TaxID=2302937 RepID=UPI0013D8C5DC|nr:hypothetical protein [Bacteroides sp. 519]NDV56876.1 hypothetical protein [Bacteroides sp. 519]
MILTKKEKIIGVILAGLLFLITLSSTFFFLGKLKISVVQWVAFNSCSPTSFLYLLLFLVFLVKKNASYLMITFLPIYFLGTMSMFVLPWNEANIIAHVGHIIMTLNLMWVLYVIFKHKEYKALGIGLLFSMLLFVPYIAYVLSYNQAHAEEMLKLFL